MPGLPVAPFKGARHCHPLSILKHTNISVEITSILVSLGVYALEYPVLPQDMIGIVPYPGVLLTSYRLVFMCPVRPFASYYSV